MNFIELLTSKHVIFLLMAVLHVFVILFSLFTTISFCLHAYSLKVYIKNDMDPDQTASLGS